MNSTEKDLCQRPGLHVISVAIVSLLQTSLDNYKCNFPSTRRVVSAMGRGVAGRLTIQCIQRLRLPLLLKRRPTRNARLLTRWPVAISSATMTIIVTTTLAV